VTTPLIFFLFFKKKERRTWKKHKKAQHSLVYTHLSFVLLFSLETFIFAGNRSTKICGQIGSYCLSAVQSEGYLCFHKIGITNWDFKVWSLMFHRGIRQAESWARSEKGFWGNGRKFRHDIRSNSLRLLTCLCDDFLRSWCHNGWPRPEKVLGDQEYGLSWQAVSQGTKVSTGLVLIERAHC